MINGKFQNSKLNKGCFFYFFMKNARIGIGKTSSKIRNKLDRLSDDEIGQLLEIVNPSIMNAGDFDRDEMVLILSREEEAKIEKGLSKLFGKR